MFLSNIQLDNGFFKLNRESNVELPPHGEYAVGVFFIGKDSPGIAEYEFEKMLARYNLKVIHWRIVPVDSMAIGAVAREREPLIKQVNYYLNFYSNLICCLLKILKF